MAAAVGIKRVSVVGDREGDSYASPEIQDQRIREYCAREGLEVLDIYDEPNISGGLKLEKRPGLYPALQAIEQGRATVLVAAYFDRLFRSLKTQAEVVERVESAGGRVLALDIGKVTNGSAAEWLSGTMLGAVSEYYRRSIGERIAASDARAVARGVPPFPRIPLGYTRTESGTLEPDENAGLVRALFALRAEGGSWYDLQNHAAASGIGYTMGGLRDLMSNRIYLGELKFGDYHNPQAHTAIIEPELFARVQQTKSQMGRRPKSDLLLSRLKIVRCDTCGGVMGPATWRDKRGRPMKRYRCANFGAGHASIDAATVDRMVEKAAWLVVADREAWATADSDHANLRDRLDAAQSELDKTLAAFTTAGVLSESAAIQKLADLRTARDEIAAQVASSAPTDGIPYYLFDKPRDDLTRDELRTLIRLTIQTVKITPGKRGNRWSDPALRVTVKSVWGHSFTVEALRDSIKEAL